LNVLDFKPHIIFQKACSIKMWKFGLHRSHSRWRWQKGTVCCVASYYLFCESNCEKNVPRNSFNKYCELRTIILVALWIISSLRILFVTAITFSFDHTYSVVPAVL